MLQSADGNVDGELGVECDASMALARASTEDYPSADTDDKTNFTTTSTLYQP